MKTIKSFKKFGKLCFLALDLDAIESFSRAADSSDEDQANRIRKMHQMAIHQSGLNIDDSSERRLFNSIEYSIREGLNILTFGGLDTPFWDMNSEELVAFMKRLDNLQISEFVYESRDSAAYESFYRLEELGWKMAGLTRRPTELAKSKILHGRESEISHKDYIYGIRIKKSKKN